MAGELAGKLFYFEDYRVGDSHPTIRHQVEKEEVIEFARQWDPQPWHIDETAAKASIFGGLTACSAHIFSLFCMLSAKWESGAVQQPIASLGFDEMRMVKPLFAGDTVRCHSVIEMVRRSTSKPERGIVACRIQMVDQHEELIFSILATFMIASRPQ